MKRRIPNLAAGPSATQSRVIKKLAPDQNGAGRHHKQHGNSLVCVRYREDAHFRYTTVELVVDIRPLPPRQNEIVGVRIDIDEYELRRSAKAVGGRWDGRAKLWRLPRILASALHLTDRIVEPNNA